MTASASGKATRQTRTRKPAVTPPPAAEKPVAPAKASSKAGVRKAAAKTQPVVDLRAEQPVAEQPVSAEPVAVRDLNAQIALAAYLMWEQGLPGDADEHWRAAERLVRA